MDKEKATSPEKKAALEMIRSQFKGNAGRSQAARLLEALSRFSLTTFEAMRYLDVYHCPARVMQLRKQGWSIATHWRIVVTEAGVNHRVGLYVLEGKALNVDGAAHVQELQTQ